MVGINIDRIFKPWKSVVFHNYSLIFWVFKFLFLSLQDENIIIR